MRASIPVVAVSLAALALPLGAQSARGVVVTGRVVDVQTNQAVPGAVVELDQRRTMTDASGGFVLRDVQPGAHHWTVTRIGYVEWNEDGDVSADGDSFTIGVMPQPTVLQGLRVVASQIEHRRRATPFQVRALSAEQIRHSGADNLHNLVMTDLGLVTVGCPMPRGARAGGVTCVFVRGRPITPSVMVDEEPWPGGLDALDMLQTQNIYTIESYGGGRYIRVITNDFAERLARRKVFLLPIGIGPAPSPGW